MDAHCAVCHLRLCHSQLCPVHGYDCYSLTADRRCALSSYQSARSTLKPSGSGSTTSGGASDTTRLRLSSVGSACTKHWMLFRIASSPWPRENQLEVAA